MKMTQYKLSLKVFDNEHRYRQKADNQDRILVSDLVLICNALHISISHFITLNPNPAYLANSVEYIIDEKLFNPITFNISSLNKMYGKSGLAGQMTKEEFAKRMGVSLPTLFLWINKGKCTIKMQQLIDMCNDFGVNIDEFINDSNIPLPKNDVVNVPKKISSATARIIEELTDLRAIVSNDLQVIAKLKRENESLQLSMKGYQVADDKKNDSNKNSSMREWVFNKILLDALPGLVQTSKDDMLKNMGMTNPTVSYNDGNITMKILMEICNKYQISSKHFFLRESETMNLIREYSFYQSKDFQQILFHPEYIADIFGRNSLTGMPLNKVLNLLGYSEQKIRSWRNMEKSSLRVNDLVDICNILSVTPSCFIDDVNKTEIIYSITPAEYFLEEYRMLQKEVIRLNHIIKK